MAPRGRRSASNSIPGGGVAAQVEALVQENRDLRGEIERLLENERDIMAALNSASATRAISGAVVGRRAGRPRAASLPAPIRPAAPTLKEKKTRRPITDPEQLAKRREALTAARAARAEKLAAARAQAAATEGQAQDQPAVGSEVDELQLSGVG
jgi:hypothetical protein